MLLLFQFGRKFNDILNLIVILKRWLYSRLEWCHPCCGYAEQWMRAPSG